MSYTNALDYVLKDPPFFTQHPKKLAGKAGKAYLASKNDDHFLLFQFCSTSYWLPALIHFPNKPFSDVQAIVEELTGPNRIDLVDTRLCLYRNDDIVDVVVYVDKFNVQPGKRSDLISLSIGHNEKVAAMLQSLNLEMECSKALEKDPWVREFMTWMPFLENFAYFQLYEGSDSPVEFPPSEPTIDNPNKVRRTNHGDVHTKPMQDMSNVASDHRASLPAIKAPSSPPTTAVNIENTLPTPSVSLSQNIPMEIDENCPPSLPTTLATTPLPIPSTIPNTKPAVSPVEDPKPPCAQTPALVNITQQERGLLTNEYIDELWEISDTESLLDGYLPQPKPNVIKPETYSIEPDHTVVSTLSMPTIHSPAYNPEVLPAKPSCEHSTTPLSVTTPPPHADTMTLTSSDTGLMVEHHRRQVCEKAKAFYQHSLQYGCRTDLRLTLWYSETEGLRE
ncbi:hypothetical protein DM01DRAFT_1391951 [Hesseltinella vesiculosa]|uniref:Uncharacterized protein n=1 Tax=Hesseltinella vesiculosa TaxID=101127 RepID=A0A1X2GEP1_9FUNG|nr:hypothetical protein DM01DRAFT_1391951 [Hesseltinella vesiculosa]